MLSTIAVPFGFGIILLIGTAVGVPDASWISVAVLATVYFNNRFNRIERHFNKLPCRIGKICGYQLKEEDEMTL